MDIRLKGSMDGVEAAGQIRSNPGTPVVFLSAFADEETLQRAKSVNPFGYIQKPFLDKDLHLTIQMALLRCRMERKLNDVAAEIDSQRGFFEALFEASPNGVLVLDAQRRVHAANEAIARSIGIDAGKLVGKRIGEVFRCPRSQVGKGCGENPGCGDCPLLTTVTAAFAGMVGRHRAMLDVFDAIHDKKGRFELADGGTIFLGEIGDLTQLMQVKLLRVLQEGTFERVGAEKTHRVDVRVISATHKNLPVARQRAGTAERPPVREHQGARPGDRSAASSPGTRPARGPSSRPGQTPPALARSGRGGTARSRRQPGQGRASPGDLAGHALPFSLRVDGLRDLPVLLDQVDVGAAAGEKRPPLSHYLRQSFCRGFFRDAPRSALPSCVTAGAARPDRAPRAAVAGDGGSVSADLHGVRDLAAARRLHPGRWEPVSDGVIHECAVSEIMIECLLPTFNAAAYIRDILWCST